MADASYVQSNFLGGEISKLAQGRIDLPDYRTKMNVCLNGFPIETGAWVRRPGFGLLGVSRNGFAARVQTFDFKASAPYYIEFTDGHLRYYQNNALAMTNDAQAVFAISSANPAVVTTTTAHGWATGDQVKFNTLGSNNPLLQGRVFAITVLSTTTFSITGDGFNIDGSTLGAFVSGNVTRVLDSLSPYVGTLWSTVRVVLCDVTLSNATVPGAVMLHSSVKPYLLQVTAAPTATTFATFSLAAAAFKDGPYLDPVPGGTLVTPSAKIGNINLLLSFNQWDPGRSYSLGDYVTIGNINYKSLVDGNLDLTPSTSPSSWSAVTGADAIVPNGFVGTDVGRLVRLYSEPPIWQTAPAVWAGGTTYAAGDRVTATDTFIYASLVGANIGHNPSAGASPTFWINTNVKTSWLVGDVVAYGGSGPTASGATYWSSLFAPNTATPGTDITKWTLLPAGAIWTWGKITGLISQISQTIAGATNIGSLTAGGGLAAAFDGTTSQAAALSAEQTWTPANTFTMSSYIGRNYAGGAQKIASVQIVPSNDLGLCNGTITANPTGTFVGPCTFNIVVNLRAKHTLPASSTDGTLLGTVTLPLTAGNANTTSPFSVISTDQTTSWEYTWVEISGTVNNDSGLVTFPGIGTFSTSRTATTIVAECQFFNPPGTGVNNGITLQILGDPLLYTTAIRTWRLGLYSDTLGWPTCGTYHEGRLWLSGTISNRIDASKSNDIFNFAPTDASGAVAASNAISYTFNADNVNTILWMVPDQLGIVCGTASGEWLVQASALNNPLTPTSIQAHRAMKHKCANIEPRRTGLTLAVVQAFKRSVLEFFHDTYSGKFSAHNIAHNVKHLTQNFIQEIAYQQELNPILWTRMGDGSLNGCTYKRETLTSSQPPEFAGWHRHTLGSTRTIEYMTVGANTDGSLDALCIVTKDTLSQTRYVELLTDTLDEGSTLSQAAYLDSAITPTSTAAYPVATGFPYGGLTLNGLWALNGQTVTAWIGGLDCGDYVVLSGSISVPYGDGVSAGTANGLFTLAFVGTFATLPAVVGFTYTSQGQLVRPSTPQESGARSGPAFGKKRRSMQYAVQLEGSQGVSVGTDFTATDPCLFRFGNDVPYLVNQQFSGIHWGTLQDTYSYDSMLAWQVTRPYICNVAAIGAFLHSQDK